MSNGDIIIAILLAVLFIGSYVWMFILSIESEENAGRIKQTEKKLHELVDFFNVHDCDIDELYEVCTLLIVQNKEQADQIKNLEKKVKKLEKELTQ